MKLHMVMAIMLCCIYLNPTSAESAPAKSLELSGNKSITPLPIHLNRMDNEWVINKRTLRVAVYSPAQIPASRNESTGLYTGMNADYLTLIERSLNVKVSVILYANEMEALSALKNGEVDTVLTSLELKNITKNDLIESLPVLRSGVALVTLLANISAPLHGSQHVTIATVNNFPGNDFIIKIFPNAKITSYPRYQEALSSVENGESDYLLGDSLSINSWLSQEFKSSLSVVKYFASPQKTNEFIFTEEQERLRRILNLIIKEANRNVDQKILRRSSDRLIIEEFPLTQQEDKWLNKNKKLKVIINPQYVPYSMVDSNKEPRGIAGDILNLISLQTGLEFEVLNVNSNDEMIRAIKAGKWDIIPAATYVPSRESEISFTIPFITTQFVTVVKKDSLFRPILKNGMTVAVPSYFALLPHLKSDYPGVSWRVVDNSFSALNMLILGSVDAVVTNNLTARYFSEHYYTNEITWLPIKEQNLALISFAVPRSKPELKSIINKSLENISKDDIEKIVLKWNGYSGKQIGKSALNRNETNSLIYIISFSMILLSLLTIYFLLKSHKRKLAKIKLSEEKEKAIKSNEQKSKYLAHISHEMRTPINAIVGFLELLQISSSKFTHEDKVSIEQAAKASHSLLELIGEVLDLEKIESGFLEVNSVWVNIDEIINSTVSLFSALSSRNGIKLQYNSVISHGESFLIDPKILKQILVNLIGNAIKFTKKGSVIVSAEKYSLGIVISVTDTGPGISQEDQVTLFDEFTQGESDVKNLGSGLGLAICKKLITHISGEIKVKSKVGQGTTVTLKLPSNSIIDNTEVEIVSQPVCDSIDLHLLIVDDHSSSRILLRRQLETLGVVVDEATNAEDAILLLSKYNYRIMLTDINLGVMDGFELSKVAREYYPDLFICGLTASAISYERDRCLDAGMNECLFKPVSISMLSKIISHVNKAEQKILDLSMVYSLSRGDFNFAKKLLEVAKEENNYDYTMAIVAAESCDIKSVVSHIHRINGTAQLLGAEKLSGITNKLEEEISALEVPFELISTLNHMGLFIKELEGAIDVFLERNEQL